VAWELAGWGCPRRAPRNLQGASQLGRRCRCKWHNWKQTGGTTQCHRRRNPHNLPRTCSNHCPLAWGLAKGSAKVWGAWVSELVAAVAEMGLSRRHRSSEHKPPTYSRGLHHILHWRPNLRNSDCHRSTCRHRNSEHSSPTSKQGWHHILHWRPNLRNPDCRRSKSLTVAEELAAEDLASLSSLLGRHRSSVYNSPTCNRGSPDTLHWWPRLRKTDCHRSTTLTAAEELVAEELAPF